MLWDTEYINQVWFWYIGLNLNNNRQKAMHKEDVSLYNYKYINQIQV